MGQIVGKVSDIFRCNLRAINSGGSKANTILAADEVWLVDTTNSLTNSLSGNCDAYIVGDGTLAAGALELHKINKDDYVFTELDGDREEAHLSLVSSNGVITKVEIVQKKLTDVIWENKTYLDIFEKNNWILYYNNTNNCGFDNNSYYPATSYQGSPTIVSIEYDTPPYSLKCFGTSNTRLRNGLGSVTATLFMAARLKCTRYSAGCLGVSCSGYSSRAAQVSYVTNGWVTKTKIYTASSEYIYIGSFNTANLDGYVDSPVVVKMSIFTNAPSLEQMTEWYEEYIRLKKKNGLSVEIPTKDYVDSNFTNNETLNSVANDLDEQISVAVKKEISDLERVELYQNNSLDVGAIAPDGTVVSGTTGAIKNVSISNVSEGQIISLRSYYVTSGGERIYDPNTEKIVAVCASYGGTINSSKGRTYNANLSSFTIPSQVDAVVISFATQSTYVNREVVITTRNAVTTFYKQQMLDGNPLKWEGNLGIGDYHWLGNEQAWYHKAWIFTGHISTWGTIKIGRGNSSGNNVATPYIEVTDTQVLTYSYTNSSFNSAFNHGLTLADDIQIIVEFYNPSGNIQIIVQSGGARWSTTLSSIAYLGECINGVGVYSGGAFTDCAFSVSAFDIDKNIWIFGDSWVSFFEQRWTYQLRELGYTNWFLNGYAGEKSFSGLEALRTLIQIHVPKMLLWLYGMNDEDTNNTTPNSSWLSSLNEVKKICSDNNIKLILATIPTTPTRNNNAKNAYVVSSGYRYVNQVAAMGADTSGNWFPGYQSEDGNHTTTAGAKALMVRYIADVPELMYNE